HVLSYPFFSRYMVRPASVSSILSLPDALPIWAQSPCIEGDVRHVRPPLYHRLPADDPVRHGVRRPRRASRSPAAHLARRRWQPVDRKSTRLNSSHVKSSYAVFCLKKKRTHI